MIIQHNMLAMQASAYNKKASIEKSKAGEKLSSGYKINRAADDAANLAISEKMRQKIHGLNQGTANLQDGISLSQVADGALEETQAILQRMNELSVKAANGTSTNTDRASIQDEIDSLVAEINRIAYSTTFNEDIYPLLGGGQANRFIAAPGSVSALAGVNIAGPSSGANDIGIGSLSLLAKTPTGVITGAGGLGAGSAGTMMRVWDAMGNESKVFLHRDANFGDTRLNVAVNGDKVTFNYNDPATGIKFEVEQSYSIHEEVDEATKTGYSFYDINYNFKNLSGKDVTYDMATAFDNFAGRYNAANPYYVNGVPHSTQTKETITGGNYQIVTPEIPGLGVRCELVTRLSGEGIKDSADKFIMLSDTINQADRNQVWTDLYLPNMESTGSSGHAKQCDEIYGLWQNKVVRDGQSNDINIMQGIQYKVVPNPAVASGVNSKDVWIQAGAESDNGFYLNLVDATAKNLKVDTVNVTTADRARNSIEAIATAINTTSTFRSQFGAYTNRMSSSIRNNDNVSENTQKAESIIRDTDMASTMIEYKKMDILQQVSQAMQAQAKQLPENVLKLLQ